MAGQGESRIMDWTGCAVCIIFSLKSDLSSKIFMSHTVLLWNNETYLADIVTRFYLDSAYRLSQPEKVFDSTMKFFWE